MKVFPHFVQHLKLLLNLTCFTVGFQDAKPNFQWLINKLYTFPYLSVLPWVWNISFVENSFFVCWRRWCLCSLLKNTIDRMPNPPNQPPVQNKKISFRSLVTDIFWTWSSSAFCSCSCFGGEIRKESNNRSKKVSSRNYDVIRLQIKRKKRLLHCTLNHWFQLAHSIGWKTGNIKTNYVPFVVKPIVKVILFLKV